MPVHRFCVQRPMCPNARSPARRIALAAALMGSALTGPVALAATAPPPAKPAPAAVVAKAPEGPKRADAATRAAAERLDPLARAAFWAQEVRVDPSEPAAGVKLAASLRALGRYDEAAQAVQQVLILKPNDLDALLEAGRVRIAQGEPFYGVEPLERAQTLAPGDWRPASLLAVAYAETKRDAESRTAYARALQLSPENPQVISNMALSLATHGQAAEAERMLRHAALLPGATARERQNLALVLGLQGKMGEAETLIRRDLPPDMADANLAYLKAAADAR